MTPWQLLTSLAFCLAIGYSWGNEAAKGPLPEIRVIKADWGGASLRDIVKVLNSSARQLWPHASQEQLKPIIVDRSRTGPIVLFRRGNEGQYIVRLDTHRTFWSQYAFQFSHATSSICRALSIILG